MNAKDLENRAPFYVFYYIKETKKKPASFNLVPFDNLTSLYNWYSLLKADQKFIFKNIAVTVNVSEAMTTDSSKIEVLHGAPSDERLSDPPIPQVPGESPVIGTVQASEVNKNE